MTATIETEPGTPRARSSGTGRTSWWQRHPQRIGLGSLILSGALLIAVGTGLLDGPLAIAALFVVLVAIVAVIMVAVMGGLETRRALAPYGLLNPGMLWLALFYLAPLFTLLRNSLSTLPSRFAVDAEFDWNFGNYADAFTDFQDQFIRAFLYAGIATVLTILIGFPLAYVIAFRGGRYRNFLIGLVIIPFFTSYLIRTIAWQSMLADQGAVTSFLRTIHLTGFLDTIGIMDGDKLLNTPAAVIGGSDVQLPAVHDPADLRQPREDRRAPRRGGEGPVLDARSAFRKIVFPLSLPGLFAGTLLTFIPASGDFVNQLYLGNPNTTMIGNSIQDQFLVQNTCRWPRRCRSC